jgi:hypothetical protein
LSALFGGDAQAEDMMIIIHYPEDHARGDRRQDKGL